MFLRQEDTEVLGRKPGEGGGRRCSDAAPRQGMPGAPWSWEKQGRILPESLWKEPTLLTPRLQGYRPLNFERASFSCFHLFVLICYGSTKKWIQEAHLISCMKKQGPENLGNFPKVIHLVGDRARMEPQCDCFLSPCTLHCSSSEKDGFTFI